MRASFPSLNGSGDSFQVFVVLEGDLALSQYLAEALAGLWSRTGVWRVKDSVRPSHRL